MEAYCPDCDEEHTLAKTHTKNYVCSRRPLVSFVYLAYGEYAGVTRPYSYGNACWCNYPERIKFANALRICDKCGLSPTPMSFERLMANFTKRMFSLVRDVRAENAASATDMMVTFPDRFQEIVDESYAANAAALAPHLPSVLVELVSEYFGCYG